MLLLAQGSLAWILISMIPVICSSLLHHPNSPLPHMSILHDFMSFHLIFDRPLHLLPGNFIYIYTMRSSSLVITFQCHLIASPWSFRILVSLSVLLLSDLIRIYPYFFRFLTTCLPRTALLIWLRLYYLSQPQLNPSIAWHSPALLASNPIFTPSRRVNLRLNPKKIDIKGFLMDSGRICHVK